jgi:hypothetical protein
VKHLEPVANLAWVKRQLEKGKKMGGVNVQDKYAIPEIANKLPFAFVHKIVLEKQRLQENSEGAITVMMSVQGCYDCAWLSLTALLTVTRNLWL